MRPASQVPAMCSIERRNRRHLRRWRTPGLPRSSQKEECFREAPMRYSSGARLRNGSAADAVTYNEEITNLLYSLFSCINCCFVVLHSNFPAIFIEFLCSHFFLGQQGGIILTYRVQKSPEKLGISDQSIYRDRDKLQDGLWDPGKNVLMEIHAIRGVFMIY